MECGSNKESVEIAQAQASFIFEMIWNGHPLYKIDVTLYI